MAREKLEKKERMTIPRQPMPAQDPEVRITNFNEVALGFTSELAITEADRCLECKKPKCVDGCPVGIDIPGFVAAIQQEDFEGALSIIKKDNTLPAICGRVCPQEDQCEIVCVTGKKSDPVAIGRRDSRPFGDHLRGVAQARWRTGVWHPRVSPSETNRAD
jgi:glutamate synthase (NADPH/NADH) small chain